MGSISWVLFLVLQFHVLQIQTQQTYINNDQLDCEQNSTTTLGYICNSPITSCPSYLTFRSNPPYNSPAKIGYLLNSDPSQIARINKISDMAIIPTNTLVIIPITCSCSNNLYQHNATYVLKTEDENYFTTANNTFEGLTTCQALMSQNPYDLRNLMANMRINVPLRCACPTRNQTQAGFRFLLSYIITWRDSISGIAGRFSESGVDNRSILIANELSDSEIIFPFTPLLVPLRSQPTQSNLFIPPSPPPPFAAIFSPEEDTSGESISRRQKWIFVGVEVGVGFFILPSLSVFLVWFV